jgi:hypothetical protein
MLQGQVEKCIGFDNKNTTKRDERAGPKPSPASKGG